MNTITSFIAGVLVRAAAALNREAANTKAGILGLGGPGPWTPGK